MLTDVLEPLVSLIFPSQCECCAKSLYSRLPTGLCAGCEASVAWIREPHCVRCGRQSSYRDVPCGICENADKQTNDILVCAYYNGPMRELLHAFKFRGRKSLDQALTSYLLRRLTDSGSGPFDALVSVPLDSHTLRMRGFNQSRALSRRLAKTLRIPEASSGLRKQRAESPQALLSKLKRELNVRGRFKVSDPSLFVGKRLLLVDDIITTGNTVSECARVLKESGALSVTAAACARGV